MTGLGSDPHITTDTHDDTGNTAASIFNGDSSSAAALAESEERFRQMAEMAGEWLWEQDPGGYYTYSSTAVYQILGISPEEVIGKHYTEFLTPQDKANQQPYATIHQPFYALINHYQHKDGHQVLTESTGLPIINAKGDLVKWRGVDRDITARKHFQDALIESEKRTRLIIECSLSAIVIMDSYGIITDWNPQAEKMFGWSRNEAIDQRLQDLIIPPRLRKAHRQGLQHFLQTGIAPLLNKVTEQVARRRDGSEFPVELERLTIKTGQYLHIQRLHTRHHNTKSYRSESSSGTNQFSDCPERNQDCPTNPSVPFTISAD